MVKNIKSSQSFLRGSEERNMKIVKRLQKLDKLLLIKFKRETNQDDKNSNNGGIIKLMNIKKTICKRFMRGFNIERYKEIDGIKWIRLKKYMKKDKN